MYDMIFRNAGVIDGSGQPEFTADVAVKDGVIAFVGHLPPEAAAQREVDASGCKLIPGIIDSHSHYDTVMFLPEYKYVRLRQGITTNIVGYCGPTPAPYDAEKKDMLQSMYYSLTDTGLEFPWTWKTVDEYFLALERAGMGSNVASFIGHGTLRTLVMGHENRKPTRAEMDRMKGMLADSIDAGALGLGLGLSYVPGIFSDQEELMELGEVIAKKGAMMAAHRRDEGNTAIEAVDEVLDIAEKTGANVHVCHLKAMGRKNWGKTVPIIEKIERLSKQGLDIKFDVYPYITGYINLHYIFPGWVQTGSREDLLARLNDDAIREKVLRDSNDPRMMARSLYTYATAEGYDTVSSGYCSHAEGYNTTASNNSSHAEGKNTTASGNSSHAEGYATTASGDYSHASGYATTALDYQFVLGKYNNADPTSLDGVAGVSSPDSQSSDETLFVVGYGTSTANGNAFRISGNGKCRGVSTFTASGADFAELFEWVDGNPDNEDRRGLFVTLDGEKIKIANNGDDYIGVISGAEAFLGNSASEEWQGKYLTDVFGTRLVQTVEIPAKIDEVTNKVITPAHTVTQYVLNPDYNPNEQYIMRENRKEWGMVGLLGQVVVIDDGTCVVGGYVKPSANGIGTASNNGYRVMKRIDENHIKVLVK